MNDNMKDNALWLVTYQLPFDLIVGIYKDEDEAEEHYCKIPEKYAPLKYPCFTYLISSQSGFRDYHMKRLVELLGK